MKINWNLEAIAKGFCMDPHIFWQKVNANSLSTQSEYTVAGILEGEVEPSQKEWDVVCSHGNIEVRNMFKKACFAPSSSTGKGRYFEESLFLEKLDKVDFYIMIDLNPVRELSQPQAYCIPSALIRDLYDKGVIGTKAHIDFAKRRQLPRDYENRAYRFCEIFDYAEFALDGTSFSKEYDVQKVVENISTRLCA